MRLFIGIVCIMLLSGCAVVAKIQGKPAVEQIRVYTPAPKSRPEPVSEIAPGVSAHTLRPENYELSLTSPEVYDRQLNEWYKQNVVRSHDEFFTQFIDIDETPLPGDVPDSIYQARLRRLVSPINLSFNDIVRSHIVTWTTRNKSLVGRILGLSQLYFPMIEEELARQNLPLELRMLPVIESALNPSAVSRAGATGLWQFMLATGRSYGLEVSSMVDDRRDPVLATRAAATHLNDLYKMYDDWTLAIAAYNCGMGNVNKALKKAGDGARTFWDIYPYLPHETRGYLPSFIAANYAYAYHKQHGIEMVTPPLPITTDTVTVSRLLHFEQVSTTLDIPLESLRALNPQYKEDIIPAVERTYSLKLPQSDVLRYIAHEGDIHAKDSIYLKKYFEQPVAAIDKPVAAASSSSSTSHTVKNGEVLGTIARRHGVTVAQIVKWNNLRNAHSIRAGQKLKILK